MQKITMFMMTTCPHCARAFGWMEDAKREHPEYADIPIEIIDETVHPDIADKYDYYYVPTYYVGDTKVHEGVASLEIVRGVYRRAIE